jgi:ATPase subunit of ABC transporter with duplicated ATPase domains
MIAASNISVVFSSRKLFENVNIKFNAGNCYGIIGANGAGKSTFLKVLSGDFESSTGEIIIDKGSRMSVLQQDHFKFDEYTILQTVVMGHKELYKIMSERDELYAKSDFTEEDGYRAADLEEAFANMNGWEAESEAEKLLNGLSLEEKDYSKLMSEVTGGDKVKILLAQALFGNPDILILDEPTNHLDFYAIKWLENFLLDFDKTVIVVSHDRHFLNNVCTHIVDIDYQEAKLFVGNYDFWRESSELAQRMLSDTNTKKEEKIAELEAFVARFSANASKSKQATSRKKMLEKITLDDIKPTSRKYPFIMLEPGRDIGKDVVKVENVSKTIDGVEVLKDISFNITGGDKVVFLSKDETAITTMLQILADEVTPDNGEVNFGITVEKDYLPKDNANYFEDGDVNLVDWLRQYTGDEQAENYVRSFLGKMLFSGQEPLKKVKVLSGGEKVRMMFSKLMLSKANVLVLDQPTNHLDLESIQSVNESLEKYSGSLFFSSHDYSFIESIANKVINLTPQGAFVYEGTFDEYMEDENIKQRVEAMYE